MIEVKKVYKRFKKQDVLNGINFTAQKGEITCLIGVNGIGKTTLLKGIMHLIPIDSGQVWIDGKDLTTADYNRVTFIPDSPLVLNHQTIREAMDFMQTFYSSWQEDKAQELLTFFHLTEEMKISELSKGNKAKVNLLLGMALDTDYLLLDEPFSGIDIFTREEIAQVFTSKLVEEKGVIITTHEIQDIENLVDKAVLLDQGKVIKEFYVEDVRETRGMSIIDVMKEVYGR